MTSIAMSTLENKLMDNIFRIAQSSGQPEAQAAAGTAETLARYAFKDFVRYFMNLEEQAKSAARQASAQSNSPLYSAPLQLNIQIQSYQQAADADDSGQPVTVHKLETAQGAASQIEIRTAETHEDGTVTQTVTVINLAVELAQTQPQLKPASSGGTGKLSLAEAGASLGFEEFFANSPYAGSAGKTLWQYEHDDAMQLIEADERLESVQAEQAFKLLIEVAYKVLQYLESVEIESDFRLTKDEARLVQEALTRSPDDVVFKSMLQLIKKKKIKVAKVRQELKKQAEELEKIEKSLVQQSIDESAAIQKAAGKGQEQPATEAGNREEALSNIRKQLKQIRKMMTALQTFEYVVDEKPENLNPEKFEALLKEFNDVNLLMAET